MTMAANDAYLYAALRTPRGKGRPGGALAEVKPLTLVAGLLSELAARYPALPQSVDDVILGCVMPVGEQGANLARTAVLHAGWPDRAAGVQLNRFCASGLEAVNQAALQVRAGWAELVLAGGVESMSRVPMGSDGGPLLEDPAIQAQVGYVPQGVAADLLATLEGWTREELDAYALESQRRAAHAAQHGYFKSLVPVCGQEGVVLLARDESIRPGTPLDALAALPPAFAAVGEAGYDQIALERYPALGEIHHLHTAGNSSGIVDGAAVVLVGSAEAGERWGLRPRARIVSAAVVGSEPTVMLTGPAPASRRALALAGMQIDDIDLVECNEAFAAVVLTYLRTMALDPAKVNVNGGAIALGHPLGATGAMLLATLLDELERRDLATGLVTLCAAGGMGIATIVERV
jgi:acetyl-CoA C-acetyltransferase